MNRLNACYAVSVLISAGLFAGCASAPAPEVDEGNAVVVNELSAAPLAGDSEMRVERPAGESAFKMVDAPGWRTIQPGVWEHGEGESKRQVVVGEAGHQWLAERTTQQIDALQAKVEGGDSAESLLQQIDQLEQVNARAQTALAGERDIQAPTPSAVSCNISLYTGAGGPIFGTSGAAGLAQASCTGGCVAFTVTSQACCGGVCSPVTSQTNTVCSSPLLMGSFLQGFGSGSASVTSNPPNVTQSSSFICN